MKCYRSAVLLATGGWSYKVFNAKVAISVPEIILFENCFPSGFRCSVIRQEMSSEREKEMQQRSQGWKLNPTMAFTNGTPTAA